MTVPAGDVRRTLLTAAGTKVVMLGLDGLGGLPQVRGGATELETAATPNLDALAARATCGLHQPVATGITPGSGPAHLALFGYDPLDYNVGRGVLSALGIGFDLQKGDVAARGNFCEVDDAGRVIDRRAGRIATEMSRRLCRMLSEIDLPGIELFVEPVKEYRFLLVLRGPDLSAQLDDTDPQEPGRPPFAPRARDPQADKIVHLVSRFIDQARRRLADNQAANMILLRGFSSLPAWPRFEERFGLKGMVVADYPMYRGIGRLLGMRAPDCDKALDSKIATMRVHWEDSDFFYLHVKQTDSAGEDGNAELKQQHIEITDQHLPTLLELEPDVLIVTGDHSTPAAMKSHSWHPVPTILWSAACRPDEVTAFGERSCLHGGLGVRFPATELIPLALAHAGRLKKYGA